MTETRTNIIALELKSFVSKFTNVKLNDAFSGKIILGKDADYDFNFHLDFEREQFSIAAVLRDDKNNHPHFWHMPLSFTNYSNNIHSVTNDLFKSIEMLATEKTKIIQTKRFLSYSFDLMYLEGDHWKNFYRHGCFKRKDLIVPNHFAKKMIYYGNKKSINTFN